MNFKEAVKTYGGVRAAAKALGIPKSSFWDSLKRQEKEEHLSSFTTKELKPSIRFDKPTSGVKSFILTSAQDNSEIHIPFWNNLKRYAEYLEAEILVSPFTYNKALFSEHEKDREQVYHPELLSNMVYNRVELGDSVIFCGEMNTLPTAVRPLSGFESYTKSKWGIFPHPKIELQSIPVHPESPCKQNVTTGTVTLPNYVMKKAGIKASFHHTIGAVIVELADDGAFFCRHLIADVDGSFQDLTIFVSDKGIEDDKTVEAITYGDIHHEKLDPTVALTTWGYDVDKQESINYHSLLTFLKPKYQFFHDLSDFSPRNHHNIGDIHFRFMKHHEGGDNVEEALRGCSKFLSETFLAGCKSIVVNSNHDNALVKWLKTADYRYDPENAIFFLETQASYYRFLKLGMKPKIFEHVLRSLEPELDKLDILFNGEDDSYIICNDIECGMHGHLGANGARPSPGTFAKTSMKANVGHSHSPTIMDGCYIAGVSGRLSQGYNKGMTSWAHAHIVTYENGKRTLITMNEGRWYG